jgi:hypothetical protein
MVGARGGWSRTRYAALACAICALAGAGSLWLVAAGRSTTGATIPCAPTLNPQANGYWNAFGTGVWTGDGLLTTSRAAPGQPYGVTCGGASVYGPALPTSDPAKITALSFDFTPGQSGAAAQAPRLVICFSDAANCTSYAYLAPSRWSANTTMHVDGFTPATGLNASWSNVGGRCGNTSGTTWAAIVACHPGASVTVVAVVNDGGSLYRSGEQVLLNNLTVNNVVAHAAPPVLGRLATVVPATGRVMVRRPHSHRFVQVTTIARVPYGAVFDATGGNLEVIAARRRRGEQSGDFYAGSFRLIQGSDGYVQGALTGRPAGCPAPNLASSARGRRTFKLWGHVKGRYRTRGHYGSASVLGTIWLTENLCSGTYFHVVEGTLYIRDFTLHRSVVLRAGHSYLAPSQPPDVYDHDGDFYSDRAQGLIHGELRLRHPAR